jgi:hypothetical protein
MKTIILPFRIKKQKGKLTRLIYNELEYATNFAEFKKEILKIYNSIPGIEVSYVEVVSQVINSNVTEEHYVANINNILEIKFINIEKILAYHSVESIANSIK